MSGEQKPLVLVVSPVPPYPLTGGGVARCWAYIDYLRSVGFRVELVTVPHAASEMKKTEARVDRLWIARPAAITATTEPVSWQTRLKNRMPPTLKSALQPLLYKLRQRSPRHNGASAVSSLTRARNPVLDAYAADVARQRNAFAVITVFAWTARLLDLLPPGTLKLLDTIDVQYQRAASASAAGYDLSRAFCSREEERTELNRADVLLAIQREEQQVLRGLCPRKECLLVEHAFPIPPHPLHSRADSHRVLFVGNLYEPNVIGINDFIAHVWPAVRKAVPAATLHVCGRVCRETTPGVEGVVLEGLVPSLDEYYEKAAVVINPVPYGTGLKIKTVEALGHGKCLVTSPPGITGLPNETDKRYFVRAIPDMAEPVIRLLRDVDLRRATETAAYAFAVDRFSPRRAFSALERRLRHALVLSGHSAATRP